MSKATAITIGGLRRAWFFNQVGKYTESMKDQLKEDMSGLKASIAEHKAGLKALKAANVSPVIQEQFEKIIKSHTEELKIRESNFKIASDAYGRMSALDRDETSIPLNEVVELITAILQIPDPAEGDTMDYAGRKLVLLEGGWKGIDETKKEKIEDAGPGN